MPWGSPIINIFKRCHEVLFPSAPEEMNFNPLLCKEWLFCHGVGVSGMKGSAMMFNACSKMFENKRDIFN